LQSLYSPHHKHHNQIEYCPGQISLVWSPYALVSSYQYYSLLGSTMKADTS
jgi:hypothetical protein